MAHGQSRPAPSYLGLFKTYISLFLPHSAFATEVQQFVCLQTTVIIIYIMCGKCTLLCLSRRSMVSPDTRKIASQCVRLSNVIAGLVPPECGRHLNATGACQ